METTYTAHYVSEGRIDPILFREYTAPPQQRRRPYRTANVKKDPVRPIQEGICEPIETQFVGLVGCCVNASTALEGDPHVAAMMAMINRRDMPSLE